MSKVLQNKIQKNTALLEGAYELFTTQGFEKTSIMDIADKAGVAKGTFYLYFNDKVEIRDAVIRVRAGKLLQNAYISMKAHFKDSNEPSDIPDKFVFIIDYLVDYLAEDTRFLKFISKHLSWGLFTQSCSYPKDPMLKAGMPVPDFEDSVNKMIELSGAKLREPRLLIFTLLELVSSACYDIILYSDPVTIEEYKPYLNRTIRLLVDDAIIQ